MIQVQTKRWQVLLIDEDERPTWSVLALVVAEAAGTVTCALLVVTLVVLAPGVTRAPGTVAVQPTIALATSPASPLVLRHFEGLMTVVVVDVMPGACGTSDMHGSTAHGSAFSSIAWVSVFLHRSSRIPTKTKPKYLGGICDTHIIHAATGCSQASTVSSTACVHCAVQVAHCPRLHLVQHSPLAHQLCGNGLMKRRPGSQSGCGWGSVTQDTLTYTCAVKIINLLDVMCALSSIEKPTVQDLRSTQPISANICSELQRMHVRRMCACCVLIDLLAD